MTCTCSHTRAHTHTHTHTHTHNHLTVSGFWATSQLVTRSPRHTVMLSVTQSTCHQSTRRRRIFSQSYLITRSSI